MQGTALLLLLFAGFQVYTAVTTESYIDADEIYYQYYMKHVEGPLTHESVDWLSQQQEEFSPHLPAQCCVNVEKGHFTGIPGNDAGVTPVCSRK